MEIARDQYLRQLIEKKDNGRVKIVTGIRRSGKSFFHENSILMLKKSFW